MGTADAKSAGLVGIRRIWLLAICTACLPLGSCFLGGSNDAPFSASCDAVAAHLEVLCGPYIGVLWAERIRQIDCGALEGLTLDAEDRRCLLRAESCDEAGLAGCRHGGNVTVLCSTGRDCPGSLFCTTDSLAGAGGVVSTPGEASTVSGSCVRCRTDSDCDTDRGCVDGLCLDKSSLPYTASQATR